MKKLLFLSAVFLSLTIFAFQDKKPLPKGHCLGVKGNGDSCRIVPKDSRYCHWHEPKCAKEGCRNPVDKKGDFCICHLK
jgi:hypothetical protein